MQITGVGLQLQLFSCGHPRVATSTSIPGRVNLTIVPGIANCALSPTTGIDIASSGSLLKQIHRHHGELQGCPTLKKQNLEIVWDLKNLTGHRLRFVVNRIKMFAPVAHFNQCHSGAVVIHEFSLSLLQYIQGQGRRSGTEIIDSTNHA